MSLFYGEASDQSSSRIASRQSHPSGMQVFSSASLALTELFPPSAYTKFVDIVEAVSTRKEELTTHDIDQYLSFKNVTPAVYAYIVNERHQLGQVRLTYYPDIKTLIIKVPTRPHETAHANFGLIVHQKVMAMNIGLDEFSALAATTYEGTTGSKKEGDSSFINVTLRPNADDWPSLVIESGVSESLQRLRQDAAWWITNSRGRVRIVLVIKVTRNTQFMSIEKYVPAGQTFPYPNTRQAAQSLAPRLVSTTDVHQGANPPMVLGPPVILEFERVLGRRPVPPERDIVLGPPDLLQLARLVFR